MGIITALRDHQAVAINAAKKIADAINAKTLNNETFVLGLATGATMDPVYAELIKLYQTKQVRFKNVLFFNLDNYIGLRADDLY